MKLKDLDKLENMVKEHEIISDKAFGHGKATTVIGLEKHRDEANYLRSICKELRDKLEI